MVTRSVPAHCLGGMEINTLKLSKALVESGHKVVVLTTSHPGGIEEEMVDGVRVIYAPHCPPEENSRLWGTQSIKIFSQLNQAEPFDLIHGHGSAVYYLHKSNILRRASIPLVVTYHSTHLDWIESSIHTDLCSWTRTGMKRFIIDTARHIVQILSMDISLANGADAIIALDEKAVGRIAVQYCIAADKIYVIPTSVDTHLFHPSLADRTLLENYSLSGSSILLLAIGRLERDKGFHISLEVLARLRSVFPDIHLLIVGEGTYRKALDILVQRLGLQSHVTFAGAVPPEKCPAMYNLCDIVLNPILHPGGYPTTVVEAMACAKAIITTDIGGVRTLIQDGFDGYLVQRGAIMSMVQIITNLLSRREQAHQIGVLARQKILEQFSVDTMLEQTLALYSRLIRGST